MVDIFSLLYRLHKMFKAFTKSVVFTEITRVELQTKSFIEDLSILYTLGCCWPIGIENIHSSFLKQFLLKKTDV